MFKRIKNESGILLIIANIGGGVSNRAYRFLLTITEAERGRSRLILFQRILQRIENTVKRVYLLGKAIT